LKYDIYYQNSVGTKLEFCNIPYLLETGDFLDFAWEFTSSTNYNAYGGKIDEFTKSITSKKLKLTIMAWTEADYIAALDKMIDVFEYDIINKTPGKLYCNGNYMKCYITAGKMTDWEDPADYMTAELTITTEYPMWIIEKEWNFVPTGNLAAGSKRYANRYPYRYANGTTTGTILQGSNSPANFKIVFHGPANDPAVIIGGNTYGVTGISLDESDYIVIDSSEGKVLKYFADGEVRNIFNARTRVNSCFERLQAGSLPIQWSGEYLLSITVFEERSMPKWSLSQSRKTV